MRRFYIHYWPKITLAKFQIRRQLNRFYAFFRSVILWVVAGALLLTFCLVRYTPEWLWQNYISNLLATLVGVGLGIPAALWISQIQERKTENERKKKIYASLYSELDSNFNFINHWLNPEQGEDKIFEGDIALYIRDTVWRAFSDGGEIQWIRDIGMLDRLALAYYRTQAISAMSQRFYDEKVAGRYSRAGINIDSTQEQLKKMAEIYIEDTDKLLIVLESTPVDGDDDF